MKTCICKSTGCQRTSLPGKNFCSLHKDKEATYGKRPTPERKKSNQWHYLYNSARWRNTSREFLKKYPICFICGAPAQVADHIQPHRGNLDLFYDPDNLQPLCNRCHSRKTLEENNYHKQSRKNAPNAYKSAW